MSWLYLGMAIVFEVIGTSFLKLSAGLTKLWPVFTMLFFYSLSFISMALALKVIEVSVAYAIWCGLGISLITLIDTLIFKTHLSYPQLFAISLIFLGSILLNILQG